MGQCMRYLKCWPMAELARPIINPTVTCLKYSMKLNATYSLTRVLASCSHLSGAAHKDRYP